LEDFLQRKQNESKLDYVKRIVKAKSDRVIDTDYVELSSLLFDQELSSTECRKRMYGAKKIIDILDEEFTQNISDDSVLGKIESERQKLEKEKIKIRTEKVSLSQLLREQARFELFIEHAVDAIKTFGSIPTKPQPITNQESNKSGLLVFTDTHYDKELKIFGLDGEILNEYSPTIFENRMWKLLNKTLHICNKEGFSSIKVFDLGDDLEGILRIGQLMNLKYGLIESAIRYAYFLASWLGELSKYVYVDFFYTEGNHTDVRLLSSKKGEMPHENMGKIIVTLVKEILSDNPNVMINNNYTKNIYTKIQGFNILGVHGEESNVVSSLKDYSHMYNKPIDFLITGHKHHANSINAGIKKGCIGVGSVIGLDEFSVKLKRVSDPTASFLVFEEGLGKTEEKTIFLY
jgi:hypothetical protein